VVDYSLAKKRVDSMAIDADEKLKVAGLRVTEPRRKILLILATHTPHHLAAETIYGILQSQKADIGLATVYRVLSQLEEVNLVVRHRFGDDVSVYELASDDHHDHLICNQCGSLQEFCNETVESAISNAAQKKGFRQDMHQLTVYGLCQNCQ
jgi:Fur family ferric uptake transcriptional regulator